MGLWIIEEVLEPVMDWAQDIEESVPSGLAQLLIFIVAIGIPILILLGFIFGKWIISLIIVIVWIIFEIAHRLGSS